MAVTAALSSVSTYSQQEGSRLALKKNQEALDKALRQTSTGLKGDTFEAYGAQTRTIQDMEDQMTVADAYVQSNQMVRARLSAIQTQNQKLIDLATQTAQQVSQVDTAHDNALNLSTMFEGMLDNAATLLNRQFNGKYLYSGSAVDTQPVDLTQQATATTSADTTYYQGNSTRLSAKVDPDAETLSYGVEANESGFEKLLRALKMAKDNPLDSTWLGRAKDLARDAISEISEIQGRLGANMSRLESADEVHKDAKFNAEKLLNEELSIAPEEAQSKAMMALFQFQSSLAAVQKMNAVLQQIIAGL